MHINMEWKTVKGQEIYDNLYVSVPYKAQMLDHHNNQIKRPVCSSCLQRSSVLP